MVSAMHQHESATGIHISSPSWTSFSSLTPSHPSRLSESSGFGCPQSQQIPTGHLSIDIFKFNHLLCDSYRSTFSFKKRCTHISYNFYLVYPRVTSCKYHKQVVNNDLKKDKRHFHLGKGPSWCLFIATSTFFPPTPSFFSGNH